MMRWADVYMARIRIAERNERRRRRVIFVGGLALVMYVAVVLVQFYMPNQQPSAVRSIPTVVPTAPATVPATPSTVHRTPTTVHAALGTPSSGLVVPLSPHAYGTWTIHTTSSAKVHSIGSGGGMPSLSRYGSRSSLVRPIYTTVQILHFPQSGGLTAQAFSRSQRSDQVAQLTTHRALRRSGFVDDPDPGTPADPLATDPFAPDPEPYAPADPLATDPFAPDPDPYTPADPLANTPLGDGAAVLVSMALLYILRKKMHIFL